MISPETASQFAFLSVLKKTFVEELLSISQEKTIRKGEWLFHEGEDAEALYLITQGGIELKFKLDKKRDIYITLAELDTGQALGWSAIVEPHVYSLAAIATEDTQLVKLDSDSLHALMEKYPEQGYIFMQGIAEAMATRFSALSQRAPELSSSLMISTALYGIGGVLVALVIALWLLVLVSSNVDSGEIVGGAIFCLIIPSGMLLLARVLQPRIKVNAHDKPPY